MQRAVGVPSPLVAVIQGLTMVFVLAAMAGWLAPRGRRMAIDASLLEFLAATMRIATPLLFAALGGILSERAGVFAVGLEGMMLAGAFGGVMATHLTGSRRSGSWRARSAASPSRRSWPLATVRFARRSDGDRPRRQHPRARAHELPPARPRARRGAGPPRADRWRRCRFPLLSDVPLIGPVLFRQPPLTYAVMILTALVVSSRSVRTRVRA